MVSVRGPVPELPLLPLQVSLTMPAGKVSLTLVPGTTVPVLGVIDEPPLLSTLVTLTSFCGVSVSVSVALLLLGLVSLAALTVTVLDNVPVAEALTVAVTV